MTFAIAAFLIGGLSFNANAQEEDENAKREKIEAEEAKKAEEAKAAELKKAEEAKKAAELKQAEEAKKAAELKKAEEAKKAAELKKAEEAKKALEAKKAEEAKKAAEAKKAEEAKKLDAKKDANQEDSDKLTKKSPGKVDWGKKIKEYETYINKYIAAYEKAMKDKTSKNDYTTYQKKALTLQAEIEQNKDKLTQGQVDEYLKLKGILAEALKRK